MSSVDVSPAPSEGELLRTIIDHLSGMVSYWDSDLRCRFANRAYDRWFGVTPKSLLGKHLRELLGPLYAHSLPHAEAALRGEPQEFERELPARAGGPPSQSLVSYVPDLVDGVVRGFFALVTDVTGLKRAEQELRESEERFRLTIDEAPIGMALVGPDGRFLRVNRALSELVGHSPDELTGLTFQAITHPDDLDADLALARKLARGEIPRYQLGKRYLRKDGTTVDVMLSGSAVRGPDGALRYFIAQIEDVTEQKRIATEQRFLAEVGPVLASTLDYEQTLTRVAEMAVSTFADLCIVDVVEDGEEVRRLKVSSRDPARAWICEVLSHIDADRTRPHLLRSVLETKQPVLLQLPTEETIASLAQSEEHHRALRAAEIRSMVAVPLLAEERLLGGIAFLSSSRSRVYGPADLRFGEELAQRAALSIENARLYRAAQRATQARDDILGLVAHDLRNPLNNILIQAKALRRRTAAADDRTPRAAETIERAALRMNRLIEDLLDVTRIEAGQLSVRRERLPAGRLVAESVEAQSDLAIAGDLDLETDLAEELPDVWADRDRLLQIFENLIGNALKFTAPGGQITVGAAPRSDDVLFWVTDTGKGLHADELPHLFDRFWQAKRGDRSGAGLGLQIVKGVVEAHGGRIWVESVPGVGTSFFFTIPAAPSREAFVAHAATDGSAPRP